MTMVEVSGGRGSRGITNVGEDQTSAPGSAVDTTESSLMPEPSFFSLAGGDPGAELAMLVLESAQEDKRFSRTAREAEERAQEAAEQLQLKAMQEKADADYASGLVGGFTTAACGLVGLAGTGASEGTAKTLGDVTKSMEGGTKVASTSFDHASKMMDMEAKHQEHLAGRHRRTAEDARDQVKDAKALIDRTIAFFKEYTAAKAEAQRAALIRA